MTDRRHETGPFDIIGDVLRVRYPWAVDYRGSAAVVYWHVATAEDAWLNRTTCIDTGCVFGGRLTSRRWPERELVFVPAMAQHYAPARPLASPVERAAQHEADDLLDLTDVSGRMHVRTTIGNAVTIDHHHAAAEALPRFVAKGPLRCVHECVFAVFVLESEPVDPRL